MGGGFDGSSASFGSATFRSTMFVNRQPCKKGTGTSRVKSVVGMYIRGEKRMEEIVHPSKISRKLYSGTPRPPTSFRSSSVGVSVVTNLSKYTYPSMEDVKLSPERSQFEMELLEETMDPVEVVPAVSSVAVVCPPLPLEDVAVVSNGSADPPTVRVADVDRIDFEGEDMAVKLRVSSPSAEKVRAKVENSRVECSIRPSRPRDSELDLIIAPSKQHVVSEMLLEDKKLKLQVRPMDRLIGHSPGSRIGSSKSRKSRSRVGRSKDLATPCKPSNQLQIALMNACDAAQMAANSMNFSNACLETEEPSATMINQPSDLKADAEANTESQRCGPEITALSSSCASSAKKPAKSAAKVELPKETFALPETELKPLKTDVYYYREKVAHEQKQIDDLNKEISRAESLFAEYEQQKLKLTDGCDSHRSEFEKLLQDFLAASGAASKTSASGAEADTGLNRLISDYFVKYYDSLAKKIDQFNRERSALSMVIGNLSEEQTQLQKHVSHFEQRLALKSN